MRAWIAFAFVSAALVVGSCGKEHVDCPTAFEYEALPAPTALSAEAGVERCLLSWSFPDESMPLVLEFRVYEYFQSYGLLQLVGTTRDTAFVDSLLVGNLYYCYKVSAVDANGFEGWRTDYVCAFVSSAQ